MWLTFFPEHGLEPLAHGFGPLAALNEGVLPPNGPLLTYTRQGSELITYVVGGTLSHKHGGRRSHVLQAGDFQRSSVGYSDHASYANASGRDVLHVVQLSLRGDALCVGSQREPQQKSFPAEQRVGHLHLVASTDGQLGSLPLTQDARVYSGVFDAGQGLVYTLRESRLLWLQVVRGAVDLSGLHMTAGDGVGVGMADELRMTAASAAEIVLLDLAGSPPRRISASPGAQAARAAELAGRAAAHG
jgi:redox-sensitive bicupin YhaK (pirin superfamily)